MATNEQHQSDALGRTYAGALLDLAEQAGSLAEVADEIRQLGELVRHEPTLIRLISTRTLSTVERASVIERLFKGRLSDLTYRFIQVVNQKDRLEHLPAIVSAFATLLDERQGRIEVDAYVAAALDGAEADRLAQRVGKALGKTVRLRQNVDPNLIGGLKLRIGDRLVDGSVATQLRLLKEQMVSAGREKARTELNALLSE